MAQGRGDGGCFLRVNKSTKEGGWWYFRPSYSFTHVIAFFQLSIVCSPITRPTQTNITRVFSFFHKGGRNPKTKVSLFPPRRTEQYHKLRALSKFDATTDQIVTSKPREQLSLFAGAGTGDVGNRSKRTNTSASVSRARGR